MFIVPLEADPPIGYVENAEGVLLRVYLGLYQLLKRLKVIYVVSVLPIYSTLNVIVVSGTVCSSVRLRSSPLSRLVTLNLSYLELE